MLITYINFVNILKCRVLVALVHVDVHKSFFKKRNGNLVPPAGCSYNSGSHENLVFLPLETEPHSVGKLS